MKYRKPASKADRDSLTIEVHKKRGKVVGFTVWAGKFWVLDGSIMMDKGEEKCRVFTGNRIQDLQFEYFEKKTTYLMENYLELRRK